MNRHASHVEIEPGLFLERVGLFLEDIEIGETYEHRPGKTFTREENLTQTLRALNQAAPVIDLHLAANLHRPEGIDPLHVLAVLTGMMTKSFSRIVANLAWKEVVFHSPVLVGDTVYAESTVMEKRASASRPGQGVIRVQTKAMTAAGRLVCTFERSILVYGRGQGPYAAAGY